MPSTKWTKGYYLGKTNNGNIYLSAPSWDCGWYWGFGYLGNKNCHYHIDGLSKEHFPNKNMYDALKEHFGDTLVIRDKELWTFCELVQTAYTLRKAAEVLGRGGAHYSSNPCQAIIKNPYEVTRINEIVLPAIFDAINELLEKVK